MRDGYLITKEAISKMIPLRPFLSLRLVRNPSLKERFPTSGNDKQVALLLNLSVTHYASRITRYDIYFETASYPEALLFCSFPVTVTTTLFGRQIIVPLSIQPW